MRKNILRFLSYLIIFLLLDIPWILFVVNPLYNKYLSGVMRDNPQGLPALFFYLVFVVFLQVLAQNIEDKKKYWVIFFFGFVSYATYSLTNMAIIEGWNYFIVLGDVIWGGILSLLTYFIGDKLYRLLIQKLSKKSN